MKQLRIVDACMIALILRFGITAGLAYADDAGEGENGPVTQGAAEASENVQNSFPVQGRLTDAAGLPLTGVYTMTFRLYTVPIDGTAICPVTKSVQVVNGLFSVEVSGSCANQFSGQQMYLGIKVNGNGEMTPRQTISAIPYAWSLKPGPLINGTMPSNAMVHIENSGTNGRGLRSYATSTTGQNWGVIGASKSPDGKRVVLPVTIPGQILRPECDDYRVRFLLFNRQPQRWDFRVCGAWQELPCAADFCYDEMLNDAIYRGCSDSQNPFGCSRHFDFPSNNVLSNTMGFVYIIFEIRFIDDTGAGWVDIGGVKLTLAHQ